MQNIAVLLDYERAFAYGHCCAHSRILILCWLQLVGNLVEGLDSVEERTSLGFRVERDQTARN